MARCLVVPPADRLGAERLGAARLGSGGLGGGRLGGGGLGSGGLGAMTMGTVGTIEGSGIEVTLTGAEELTEGRRIAGTEASTGDGRSERGWPVMTSAATPPPARARQPAAASGPAHRRPVR